MSESFWSDAALEKQARTKEHPNYASLLGLFEPRVPATVDERCRHCGSDAREESFGGGEVTPVGRFCGLCLDRKRDEDYEPPLATTEPPQAVRGGRGEGCADGDR